MNKRDASAWPLFTKWTLPDVGFPEYRKKMVTRALKIRGPFRVETLEGEVACPNGYLAIDAKGYPYPIDKEIFEETYERID